MTVKECDAEPSGLIVPVNVSVASTGLGAIAVADLLHAAAVTTNASMTTPSATLELVLTEKPAVSDAGTPSADATTQHDARRAEVAPPSKCHTFAAVRA